jgi:hypothetical protein
MRPGRLATALGCAASWLALALPAFAAPAGKTDDSRVKTIRLVANEVIERAMPRLLGSPTDTARRISVKEGLVGVGAYNPRGGADLGMYAPPRHLFPRVGAGNSLNVDPNTGRSYFTNTP